jgi:transposase
MSRYDLTDFEWHMIEPLLPNKLTLTEAGRATSPPLLADKGHDANSLRNAIIERKAWANIAPKANRKDPICFSPFLHKARNLVERLDPARGQMHQPLRDTAVDNPPDASVPTSPRH